LASSSALQKSTIVADLRALGRVRLAVGAADVREHVERALRTRADHAGIAVHHRHHLVALGLELGVLLLVGTSCGPVSAAIAAAVTISGMLVMWLEFIA
jgi:hypothetical protein